MTEFTQEQYRLAMASIDSGAVTSCEEPNPAADPGMFQTLYISGFIRGQDLQGLNRFCLTDIKLTVNGRNCLASFNADKLSQG